MKRRKQFDRWRAELMPGLGPTRRVWPKVTAAAGVGLLTGLVAIAIPWSLLRPGPGPIIAIEPRLELVQAGPMPILSTAATAIDTQYVQRVTVYFLDSSRNLQIAHEQTLYSSPAPVIHPDADMVRLAQLVGRGAEPFTMPVDVRNLGYYQLAMEADTFDPAPDAQKVRYYAQPNFRQMERRDRPWPIWIESPQHDAVLDSPVTVKGQAYEDGFLQLWTKPKLWGTYYLKGPEPGKRNTADRAIPVKQGQPFSVVVREGSSEGFELYALFAKKEEYLPAGDAIKSLPRGTDRVDVLGPIDIFLRTLRGPVRTDEELKEDLELVRKISARFTSPPQDMDEFPRVALKFACSGRVSPQVQDLNLRYVLGVRPIYPAKLVPGADPPRYKPLEDGSRPGHYVWIQSAPWSATNGGFEGKIVQFGVEEEFSTFVFDLWLIAVRPETTTELGEGQAWLASALPENCVRAASVRVAKILETPESRD